MPISFLGSSTKTYEENSTLCPKDNLPAFLLHTHTLWQELNGEC